MPFPSVACPEPQGEELHPGHTQQERGRCGECPRGPGQSRPCTLPALPPRTKHWATQTLSVLIQRMGL